MTQDFGDRLETARYAEDPLVHIFRCDRVGPDGEGLWIAERVWDRARLVGAAYEMPLLSLLDGSTDPVFLNDVQCRRLETELRFVGELVADAVLEALVGQLISLLNQDSHGASKDAIGIEFP
jgi:hypothetical protein